MSPFYSNKISFHMKIQISKLIIFYLLLIGLQFIFSDKMIRAPLKYYPTHYDLFIHIGKNNYIFDSEVAITFQKNEDDNSLLLNINNNITIKSVEQNNKPLEYGGTYPQLIIYRSTDPDQDFSTYPIIIKYRLKPTTDASVGFYLYKKEYFTLLEPNYAPYLLPCIYDPMVRSTFRIRLRIPIKYTGISNMPIENENRIDDEKEITFETTPKLCAYLVNIYVCKLDYIEGETVNGLPVKLYAEKGHSKYLKDYLNAAVYSIEWIESKTTVKYNLPHLQLIKHSGISKCSGNWGLISLSDIMSKPNFVDNTMLIMREISHHWFGDFVSVKWLNSVWLSESFAQFYKYLIYKDYNKYEKSENLKWFAQKDGIFCLNNYFDSEKVIPDETIDFVKYFSSEVYKKGAFVLKMFIEIIGVEKFFAVCSNWLINFKNKIGDVNDFIEIVNNTLKTDYSDFFNIWLTKVGFPSLNVVEIYDGSGKIIGVRITQSSSSNSIYQFKIPIIYEKKGLIKKATVLMNDRELDIDIKFDWILINDELGALCTVIYSQALLEKLLVSIKENKISKLNCELISNYLKVVLKNNKIDQNVCTLCQQIDDYLNSL